MAVPELATGRKLVRVPPATSMSARLKLVLGSLRVKLMVSVLPMAKVPVPARATMTVGGVMSTGGVAPLVV